MKLAVGHPVFPDPDDPFTDIVKDYRQHISEVYFAWPGTTASWMSGIGVDQNEDGDIILLREWMPKVGRSLDDRIDDPFSRLVFHRLNHLAQSFCAKYLSAF